MIRRLSSRQVNLRNVGLLLELIAIKKIQLACLRTSTKLPVCTIYEDKWMSLAFLTEWIKTKWLSSYSRIRCLSSKAMKIWSSCKTPTLAKVNRPWNAKRVPVEILYSCSNSAASHNPTSLPVRCTRPIRLHSMLCTSRTGIGVASRIWVRSKSRTALSWLVSIMW